MEPLEDSSQFQPQQPIIPQPLSPLLLSIIVSVVVILIASVTGALYLTTRQKTQSSALIDVPKVTSNISLTPSITLTPTPIHKKLQSASLNKLTTPSIVGSIKKINKDLGLIKDPYDGVDYYETGKFVSGKYADYTRIVAFSQGAIMGYQPNTYVFITKDFTKFILEGNPTDAKAYPKDDYRNPLDGLNVDKIEKVEQIESDLPDVIKIDNTFALYKSNIQVIEDKNNIVPTGEINNKFKLLDDFSSYKRLSSLNSFLKLYVIPSKTIGGWVAQPYGKSDINLQKQYLKETSGVIVEDSTGLSYLYDLSRLSNIEKNFTSGHNYDKLSFYVSLFFYIKKEEINTDKPLYNVYDAAVPTNCVAAPETYIVSDIPDDQLEAIGKTTDNIELYILKDKSNPLYQLQLDSKPGQHYGEKSNVEQIQFIDQNSKYQVTDYPSLSEYTKQNPLLFFKDPWGRWVILGEFDYLLPQGCGKPVIYLYPNQPTDVSIRFLQPMSFDTNIPTYHKQWFVKAFPNGRLTDLQPQYTDCNAFDTNKIGSEYAKTSCLNNDYPYLYWSGNTIGVAYPQNIDEGWYVKKEELNNFFLNKLSEIGLNKNETIDMMQYWLPQLLLKNSPYYKISFLTTKQMDKLIPMDVKPRPNSILRIFLDFTPLPKLPEKPIKPQIFNKFERKGFALVEWGGLKK